MPLHLAASSGSFECVQLCLQVLSEREDLDMLIEVNRANYQNQDALTCAVEAGSIEIVEVLLANGAKMDDRTVQLYAVQPLVAAFRGSHVEITRLLLSRLDLTVISNDTSNSFWPLIVLPNLGVTLEHLKLLKANAIPLRSHDLLSICEKLGQLTTPSPAMPAIIEQLCLNLPAESSHVARLIQRQLSNMCLNNLLCCSTSLESIRLLQALGFYIPPNRIDQWINVFRKWYDIISPVDSEIDPFSSVEASLNVLLSWDDSSNVAPLVVHEDRPVILFLAILIIIFPRLEWMDAWTHIGRQISPLVATNLSQLIVQEPHADRLDVSLFRAALSQTSRVIDDLSPELSIVQNELWNLIRQFDIPHLISAESALVEIIGHYPVFATTEKKNILMATIRTFILPWPIDECQLMKDMANLHHITLKEPELFRLLFDYSPRLCVKILLIHQNKLNWIKLARLIPSTKIFSNEIEDPVLLFELENMFLHLNGSLNDFLLFDETFEPKRLCAIAKQKIRSHLRSVCPQVKVYPLSWSIRQLQLPRDLCEWVSMVDYKK